jgi:putative transposase
VGLSQKIPVPRPKRICIPGLPHHVVQRGNNRNPTFYHSDDYIAYLAFLNEAATEHEMNVHAYVLMTNHVHLLVTPTDPDCLSLTMQSLGRRYVTYINKAYHRTGTLWQGRFKSSVVDSETYCLTCYRYIELNPLRANMVAKPADYRWSSYRSNGMGETDKLITPHPVYLALARSRSERTARYRDLVEQRLSTEMVAKIRYGARKGLPVGNPRFVADIEEHLGKRLGTGRVGRPTKK